MSKYNGEYQRDYRKKQREAQRVVGCVWDRRIKRWKAYNSKTNEHYGYYTCKDDAIESVNLGRRTDKAVGGGPKKHGADIRQEGGCLVSISWLKVAW